MSPRLLSGLLWGLLPSCGAPTYNFLAHPLAVERPFDAPLPEADAVALDALTHHRWKTFNEQEACFVSRLADLEASALDPSKPFTLLGFRVRAEPLDRVRTLPSTRLTVRSTSVEAVATEERVLPLHTVEVEVCFARPYRAISPTTTYVVLRVPYDTENIPNVGSRDGVWLLK